MSEEQITPMISGRAMCRKLVGFGIPSQKVVRNQETGNYTADFFVPTLSDPVKPAKEWAELIREAMPFVRIIDTHDTIAVWRSAKPVIYATVIFKVEAEDA